MWKLNKKIYFPWKNFTFCSTKLDWHVARPNADQQKAKNKMATCNSLASPISYPSFLRQTSKMAARRGRSATLRKGTLVAFRNQNMKYFFSVKLLDFRVFLGFFLLGSFNTKNYFPYLSRVTYQIG